MLGVPEISPALVMVSPGGVAKIGNGVEFSQFVNQSGGYYNFGPALGYTAGQSFSFWGWFKILGVDAVGFYGPYMSYYCFGAQQLMIELANSVNPGNVHIYDPQGSNDAYFNVSLNAWHFFHVFYDGTQSKAGYSIDNGAEVMLANAAPWATVPGTVLLQAGAMSPNCHVIYDEIGIVMGNKLTSAQVSYLYNSGNGRTWPITLP